MLKLSAFVTAVVFTTTVAAQSTTGITNKPDTSYTNTSAYNSTLKSHPDIRLVPELKSTAIIETKNIGYCKRKNRELKLDAFRPTAKGNGIAVIIIHGGGWRSGNRTQHYPLAQHLTEKGYTCFTPEYRLSTEALYPAAVHDVKAAVRWVRANAKKYKLKKVTILGFSAGGELAAFTGATNGNTKFEGEACNKASSIVDAIVDIDGTLSFVHPESGEGNDARGTSAGTYWFGYSKKDNYALWEDASPLKHVTSKTPPTLFLNSSVERMHAGRTDYINALNKFSIYTEVHEFDKAPHSFCLFEPWFTPTINYIDTFLQKVFK